MIVKLGNDKMSALQIGGTKVLDPKFHQFSIESSLISLSCILESDGTEFGDGCPSPG
jgi:hypothetical protein